MICKVCGRELPDNSKFCPRCGDRIDEELIKRQNAVDFPPINYQEISPQPTTESDPDYNYTAPSNCCQKCGRPIPEGNTLCSDCNSKSKPKSASGLKTAVIAMAVIIALLLSCNIVQFVSQNNAISEQADTEKKLNKTEDELDDAKSKQDIAEQELSDVQQELSEANASLKSVQGDLSAAEKKYEAIKGDADLYSELTEAVKDQNIGYASDSFYASQGVLYISKTAGTESIKVTVEYSNCTVYFTRGGSSVSCEWSKEWNNNKTDLFITPESEGITTVDFTNNSNSQTFRVIIIVY